MLAAQPTATTGTVENPTKISTCWVNPNVNGLPRHQFLIRLSHVFNGQPDWTELKAFTNDVSLNWQLKNLRSWQSDGYQVVSAGVEYNVA